MTNTIAFVVLTLCVSFAIATRISMPYKYEYRVQPFTQMPKPEFHFVDGATVSIEFGYVQGHDKLFFDYQGDFPIEGEFVPETGVLVLAGRATLSEYNTAISSVVFVTTSADGLRRKITWAYGASTFFASLTKHFYKIVPKRGISWSDSLSLCKGLNHFGMQGYLATLTSSDEMMELGLKVNFSAWIGGTDAAEEGKWRWVSGPEGLEDGTQGRLFWSGSSMYAGGYAPYSQFSGWNRFQPDNGAGNENFLILVNSADPEISYWADATNTAANVGGFVCEFGGMDEKAIADMWSSFTESTELYLGCSLLLTQGECVNHQEYGCAWNIDTCQQISCASHQTETKCADDWRCEWNIDGLMGVCLNNQCGIYATSDACDADPSCTPVTIAGVFQCHRATCADRKSSCSCNQLRGCSWRSERCGYDEALDCNGMDIVYLLDGSATMTQQFGRFDQGFLGVIDTLARSQPVLTGTPAGQTPSSTDFGQRLGFVQYGATTRFSPMGAGAGGRLTGSPAEVITELSFHQRVFPASPPQGRYINGALMQAANMFYGSSTRRRVLVVLAAGAIEDAAAISKKYSQDSKTGGPLALLARYNVTVVGAVLRPIDPETVDSVGAAETLKLLVSGGATTPYMISITLDQLRDQAIYGLCGSQTLGLFLNPAPISMLCNSYQTVQTCEANPVCSWDMASMKCENSACLKNCVSGSSCEADPSCSVSKSECVQACTGLNDTVCGVTAGIDACSFNWLQDRCDNVACVGNPTEDGCIADTEDCVYDPSASMKCRPRPCSSTESTECIAHSGCSWNGKQCFEDKCPMKATSETCLALPQCTWSNSQCVQNFCGQYLNEKDCQFDVQCQWSISASPPACGPAPCTYYNINPTTAQQNCAAHPDACYWQTKAENGLKDLCVVKTCDILKTSCECSTLDQCVWRNNQCKDNRFVQCPAIDVVFLVEGTRVMLDSFGRHPNGYIGVIEAIRSWSKEAPFSAMEESTGFRMSIVDYGQDRLALVPPEGSGATVNLTGSPSKWYGVDRTLDWHEQHIVNYATAGAGGAVAIKPALKKAIEIFNAAPTITRNRMAVILGHSAITDGANELEKEIAVLDSMGVNIFANVIRRFNEMTPGEQKSADFMRPFASDPHSVHFLMATIDNVRSTLLEKFCDPSTGTGKVLKVSRDRELPCHWLQGRTECSMQGSCAWNANATLQCPLQDQCPNLECQTLPDALKERFECKHCKLSSGTFVCSLSNNEQPPRGLCQRDPCMSKCQSVCTGPQCKWNVASSRCERSMCTATNMADCNADKGCVWSMSQKPGSSHAACVLSQCSRLRSVESCTGLTIVETYNDMGIPYSPCKILEDLTPPICLEQRCPQMDSTTCQAQQSSCLYYSFKNGRKCEDRTCTYSTSEFCEMDATCYWNRFENSCHPRTTSCVLSGYSEWAPCSSSCGPSMSFKTRAIVQFPTTGSSCAAVAALGCNSADGTPVPGCNPNGPDNKMSIVQSCANPPNQWIPSFPGQPTSASEWPMDCPTYCISKSDRLSCVADNSCQWKGGRCQVKKFLGCHTLNQTACAASDMCIFDQHLQLCTPVMNICPYGTQLECVNVQNCGWRTGSTANSVAETAGLPIQLFNPGQPAIYPFYNLVINSNDQINGASVVIETNYQRGKDMLEFIPSKGIRSQWIEQSGTLKLTGTGTVSDYAAAIRFVTFSTASTRIVPRRISWSFGNNTAYATSTRHHYRSVSAPGESWAYAKAYCAARYVYGLQGYLATVTSAEENDFVSSKILGVGWVSGDDSTGPVWQISSGPERGTQFWTGASKTLGGFAVTGKYSNWAPPNSTNVNGEPTINGGNGGHTGSDRLYLSRSGLWESRSSTSSQVDGFICEFGGMKTDSPPPYPIGGGMFVGIGGCVTTPCLWHNTQSQCEMDIECMWRNGICQAGCSSRGTESECAQSPECLWDAEVLPPTCDVNRCTPLGIIACNVDPQCEYDPQTRCKYREGCRKFNQQECALQPACQWTGTNCIQRQCTSYKVFSDCEANPTCRWDNVKSKCDATLCIAGTRAECLTDKKHCMWKDPDGSTTGFQPGGATVLPFANGNTPNDIATKIAGITIVVTEGFQQDSDLLHVDPEDNMEQEYTVTYDSAKGVLRLIVNPGVVVSPYKAFKFMQKAVKFSSVSSSNVRRKIRYTMGVSTTYSDLSNKVLQWKAAAHVGNFTSALQLCSSSKYFGTSGTLATITNEVDNLLLRSLKASGWIAAVSDDKNLWSWRAQNGDLTPFWTGLGALGKPIVTGSSNTSLGTQMFAQWIAGEPAFPSSKGFVTVSGGWKAVKDGAAPASGGVLCQYAAPDIRIGYTQMAVVVPTGCFVAPCLGLLESQCKADPTCVWVLSPAGGECTQDPTCITGKTPTACHKLESCYWDYSVGMCRSSPPTICSSARDKALCANLTQCEWNPSILPRQSTGSLGACVFKGCAIWPASGTCVADPVCQWVAPYGPCVPRLCGYQTPDSCWRDKLCMWKRSPEFEGCTRSQCTYLNTSAGCTGTDSCKWNTSTNVCQHARCTTKLGKEVCQGDVACLYDNSQCTQPVCNAVLQSECEKDKKCYFSIAIKKCRVAQCVSNHDLQSCEQGEKVLSKKPCIWEPEKSFCRQPTYAEQHAPPPSPGECKKEVNPNLWWLWAFLVVIILLLGTLFHRLYLAYAKGGGFALFEATRKNYKYSPHQLYAKDLFEEAQKVGEETNFDIEDGRPRRAARGI